MYRLATLLSGNARLAAGVISAVVDAQPDVSQLDGAHLDRLTVLRSREISPGMLLDAPGVSCEVAKALAGLHTQLREAWIFARVYRMDVREMARAMDCSTSATQRHLDLADEAMAGELGVPLAAEAPAQLLRYVMALEVPEFYRAARRRRRLLKWMLVTLGAVIVLVLIVALGQLLARTLY